VQEFIFSLNKDVVRDWMKGERTSEEINKLIAGSLPVEYIYLWDVFVRDCKEMYIDQHVLEKINILRDVYTAVLITDNMDCFDRFTVPVLGLKQHFDAVVNSSSRHQFKNDNGGKLFVDVATESSSQIVNSVLADNSENTCRTFSNLGGRSLFVTKEIPLSYWLDALRSEAGM